jgi:hypothetical protein
MPFSRYSSKPKPALSLSGLTQEQTKTVKPCADSQRISEFAGCRSHDVEFVDPRREDQQRNGVLRLRRRVELDQFEQLVAPDDLARGGGDVLANDELCRSRPG